MINSSNDGMQSASDASLVNTSISKPLHLNNLNAATIPLSGKHLIEASAGTGKTYNITRIYLRLLLERQIPVEKILLMTFTKDATQELRGRIDAFIRLALSDWASLSTQDNYFAELEQRIDASTREFLLKRALLFLDEAAIFTIHGFCQRVLTQYAFSSGLPFAANMTTNANEITLQACQDWYRSLAKEDESNFTLLASFWPTPDSFISSFSKAISHRAELSAISANAVEAEFIELVKHASVSLMLNADLFETALIIVKKGKDQQTRRDELAQLLTWLDNIISGDVSLTGLGQGHQAMPDAFFDGKRYARSVHKEALLLAFNSVKTVKEQLKLIVNKINRAKAYTVVKKGIYVIRESVTQQKEQANLLDFDDLINTLANCLTGQHSAILAKQLLNQYPVALIDEFQDTDPMQFSILQAIYYSDFARQADAGLYLIGDPKQAIYGFRGGDIFAYLNARQTCDFRWLMDTNWRSSASMISAYNQVFCQKANTDNSANINAEAKNKIAEKQLDDQIVANNAESVFGFGIPYQRVLAGKQPSQKNSQKVNNNERSDVQKALQFIHFSNSDNNNANQGDKVSQSQRFALARWCAEEIYSLLNNAVEEDQPAPINPKDIAILVRDGAEADDIQKALQQAGLKSVFLSDRANLFHSEQAKQLISLLKGIIFAENERYFVAALASGLLGYTAEKLEQLQLDEFAYQSLKLAFIDYRQHWHRHGFISMAIHLLHNRFDLPNQGKDRCLTNILHLFETLQAASVRFAQGTELLHWFEQQCDQDNSEVETELRLESEGDLIRVITQHGSKGMEYPYVFIPFATRHKDPLKFGNKSVSYIEYHDKNGNLCLSLDGSKEAKAAMASEAYAETIRLLYVAITRAEQRCYVLSCAFDSYHLSPLGQTLNLPEPTKAKQACSQQDTLHIALQTLQRRAPNDIAVRQVELDGETYKNMHSTTEFTTNTFNQSSQLMNNQVMPSVSQFTGKIERDWWLSSFSALSRNLRHAGISLPDRDMAVISQENTHTDSSSQQKMCFQLAKGAHTGNLLHDILEHTDFNDPDWYTSIEKPLLTYGEHTSSISQSTNEVKHFSQDDLIAWLDIIIRSPFITSSVVASPEASRNDISITQTRSDKKNTLLDKQNTAHLGCLADLTMQQTLRESEFYFPMQGQGTEALAKLLTDHRNNAVRDKRALNHNYQQTVNLPNYQKLSGMMHGFIDLIFEYDGKYYLCDYKSNHLGDDYTHYQHDSLLNNIEQNYYDLQYLIYALALHKYLQQNLIDYDVEKHFGGVYYLYLRGMNIAITPENWQTTNQQGDQHSNQQTNQQTYQQSGVYYRQITAKEIEQLTLIFTKQCPAADMPKPMTNYEGENV